MPSDPFLPPDQTPTPVPPSGEPGVPLTTSSAQTTSLGLDPNVEAGLSVLLFFVSGVIFFVLEKRNQFVRFWAMQAIFFGVACLVAGIVIAVVGMILLHIPLIATLWTLLVRLISLGLLLVWLFMLYNAFTGKPWELPVLGKLARDQASRTPFV